MEAKKQSVSSLISIILASLNVLAIIAVALLREPFVMMFKDFGTELPVLTTTFLNTPRAVWLSISAALACFVIAKEFTRAKGMAILMNVLIMLLLFTVIKLLSIAMLLPVQSEITQTPFLLSKILNPS